MITSFLTQLERKYEHVLDEKGKKYIYFATDGAKRMRQIILDLLDFSRVGRIDSDKTLTDMNQIVSDVLTMNHRLILEKGAIIESERLPIVTASKTLMTQVMQNIIVNAVKYQMSGNTPRVHVFCKDVVEHWQFSVSDNGIGINPEYKDKIFNIFQRLHGKDEYSGTGVGLAVSKKAVEYHQGKIWVEENPTGGSIFHFTIKKDTL
jgi:light-regulated signal transduction histidine kinase (bacteriophytochrome)